MNDYDRIARVIGFLDQHQSEQPSLARIAQEAGLSTYHFHRLFTRWAGITPKGFLQCLTVVRAKEALAAGQSVLDAALDAGLSGPGRLHDLCVNLEAASPGELKSGGRDWTIQAGFVDSPFGTCLIGDGPRGICHVSFTAAADRPAGAESIARDWPHAQIQWDLDTTHLAETFFAKPTADEPRASLRVVVRGTDFQVRVWRALLRIPHGSLTSYGRLAEQLGDRAAARAVGSAVGQNRLAFLIPCHRVIRETGVVGDYRWGTTRKKAMLAWEGAAQLAHPDARR